jgi:hypothetical protein
MIVRAALLLAILILVLAIIGRAGSKRVGGERQRPRVQAARKCPSCDAYVLVDRPEPCSRAGCPWG